MIIVKEKKLLNDLINRDRKLEIASLSNLVFLSQKYKR